MHGDARDSTPGTRSTVDDTGGASDAAGSTPVTPLFSRAPTGATADGEPGSPPHPSIYLLPNLITTGAMFAGFFAIAAAMDDRFEAAAIAIFVAIVLDTADGRVARFTRTSSAFGAEYDSLSDMVAFGVAPALLVFSWSLQSLGQFGWMSTFIYMACTALRLARFNVVATDAAGDHQHSAFHGLPSPSAAAIVAGTVWVITDIFPGADAPTGFAALLLALLAIMAGLLMVAPISYWSPKPVNFKGRISFINLVIIVVGFAVVLVDPPKVLLGGFMLYALSAPAYWLWKNRMHKASGAR